MWTRNRPTAGWSFAGPVASTLAAPPKRDPAGPLGRTIRPVDDPGCRSTGRLTIYVTDMEAYRGSLAEIGAEYRTVFGKHFPAISLVAVTELVDPRALVEIEATAVIPQTHRAPATRI